MTAFLTFRTASALRMALIVTILFLLDLLFFLVRVGSWPPTALHDFALLFFSNAVVILVAFPLAQTYEQSAQTDFLTSLSNRSHGYAALITEIERARRYNEQFAIILFDIDHFKKINDSCGHPCGDAVLRQFAGFVDEHIRRTDLLSRWGGEEFLLMMTHCDLVSARLKADHLRQQIKNRAFHSNIYFTASFGVTAYYPYDTPNTLLERADNALYRAKRNGRNCVEVE
jgi:diguanylate cyclase (GGDEF)-like protein